MAILIGKLTRLYLGNVGENESRTIDIDVSDWLQQWPDAIITMTVQRPGEDTAYIPTTEVKDNVLSWIVRREDVAISGNGMVQIRALQADTDRVYLSRVVRTVVEASMMGEVDESAPPPEYGWVDTVILAAADAQQSASEAEDHADRAEAAVANAEQAAAAEAQKAVEAIRAKGEEILDAIPDDYITLSSNVDQISDEMSKIASVSPNLFDKDKAVKGGYYDTNTGEIVTYEYGHTCLIPITAGTYTFAGAYGIFGITVARVPTFDSSGNYVKTITGTSGDKVGNATLVTYTVSTEDVADGVAFAGFTANDHTLPVAMYVRGTEYPAQYQPYGAVSPSDSLRDALADDPAFFANPLNGKTAAFDGDSICNGASAKDGLSGWAGRIGAANGMNWKNYGVGGGTITAGLYFDGSRARHWISRNIDTIREEMPALDYLILEGGTNDADLLNESTQMGTYDLGDFGGVYDDTTFCGALETLLYKAVTYYPGAKIGYIVAHRMGYNQYTSNYDTTGSKRYRYFVKAMEICKKWGVPYLNLWDNSHMNPKLQSMYNQSLDADGNISGGYLYTDGQHLTPAGYDRITPMIEAWMRTL